MKRILALFLAAVLACSMTACLKNGEPEPISPPGSNGIILARFLLWVIWQLMLIA